MLSSSGTRNKMKLSIRLALLLWQDEVSTAADVSLSSGRGMGLAAIRSLVESLHGQVKLDDRQDGRRGTCLHLILPLPSNRMTQHPKVG